MTSTGKSLLAVVLAAEFLAVWVFSTNISIERADYLRALRERQLTPSAQAEVQYQRQRGIVDRQIAVTTTLGFLLLALPTVAWFRKARMRAVTV